MYNDRICQYIYDIIQLKYEKHKLVRDIKIRYIHYRLQKIIQRFDVTYDDMYYFGNIIDIFNGYHVRPSNDNIGITKLSVSPAKIVISYNLHQGGISILANVSNETPQTITCQYHIYKQDGSITSWQSIFTGEIDPNQVNSYSTDKRSLERISSELIKNMVVSYFLSGISQLTTQFEPVKEEK
jgi:hypothetical protein